MSSNYAKKENLHKALRIEKLERATMTQLTRQWSAEKLLLVVSVVAIVAGVAVGTSVGYAVHYSAPT